MTKNFISFRLIYATLGKGLILNTIFKYRSILFYFPFFIIISLLVFYPTYFGSALWDDWFFIFRNKFLTTSTSPLPYFNGSEFKAWPLTHAFFWLLFQVFHFNYSLYHLVSIVLHGINGYLCYLLLKQLKLKNYFLISILFLVHPLHLFTVAWIIQIKTLLSLGFFLSSMIFLNFFFKRDAWAYFFASIILYFLSLISKSTSAIFCLTLLACIPFLRIKYNFQKLVLIIGPYIFLGIMSLIRTLWDVQLRAVGAISLASFLLFISVFKFRFFLTRYWQYIFSIFSVILIFSFWKYIYMSLSLLHANSLIISFKNFIRYVVFIILPYDNKLFPYSTTANLTSFEFIIIFFFLCLYYLLLKKLYQKNYFYSWAGLIFFTLSIYPFCGIFNVPLFTYSNFSPYWLSIPFLGLLPMISDLIESKFKICIIVVIYSVITNLQAQKFYNTDSIFIESLNSTSAPDSVKVSLVEHYIFTGQCKKAKDAFKDIENSYAAQVFFTEKKLKACQLADKKND